MNIVIIGIKTAACLAIVLYVPCPFVSVLEQEALLWGLSHAQCKSRGLRLSVGHQFTNDPFPGIEFIGEESLSLSDYHQPVLNKIYAPLKNCKHVSDSK